MKMFSDCSGECCVCACGDFCLAGHGDDDYSLASKEQIIARLDKGEYSSYRNTMIDTLEKVYGYKYNCSKEYVLSIKFTANKKIDGVALMEVIKDAALLYAAHTKDEVRINEVFVEEA